MRILRSFLFFLLATVSANVYAGDYVWGTVISTSGAMIQIDSTALLVPKIGAKVEVVIELKGGGVAVVATGKLTKLYGTKMDAKIEQATGKINVGQRVRIEYDSTLTPEESAKVERLMREMEAQYATQKAALGINGTLTWPKLYGGQVKPQPNRNPSQPEADKQGRVYVEAAATLNLKGQLEVTVILRRYESAADAAEATATMLDAAMEMQKKMITAMVKGDLKFLEFMHATNFVAEDRREGERRLVMVTLGPGSDNKPRRLKSMRIFRVYQRYLMTFIVKNEGRWPEDPAPLKPKRMSTWPGLMQKQTASIVTDLEAYGQRVADSWEGGSGSRPEKKMPAKIRAGDRIETIDETPIKSGEETVATLAAGTQLTAGEIQDEWVGVTIERAGLRVAGWISVEHLKRVVPKPASKPLDSKPQVPTSKPEAPLSKPNTSTGKTDVSVGKPSTTGKPIASTGKPAISAGQVHVETKEASLGRITKYISTISPKERRRYISASPDSRHVAFCKIHSDEFCVVVDAKEGKRFDNVVGESLQFTSDGRKCVYVARRGDGLFVVIEGTEHGPYDELGKGTPLLSPDGHRVCFTARRGKKCLVVVDGKEQQPHEQIVGLPVFSPDGRRTAYTVVDGKEHRVIVDGTPQRAYEKVDAKTIRFGADGRHVAYAASRDKRQYVVVDGVESEPFNVIFRGGGVVFNDAGTIQTLGIRNRELVRVETQIVAKSDPAEGVDLRSKTTPLGKLHKGIPPDSITVSPDGRRLAWVSLRPDRKFELIVDGIRSKPYESLRKGTLTFSPDGKRFACGVNRDGKQIVLVDGVEGQAFDLALRPKFSADGSHVYYMAQQGKGRLVVVDGVAGVVYDNIDPKSLEFSPDGRMGYVARRGDRRLVVIDGKEGTEYDDVTRPQFAPNGKSVAYFATKGKKQLVVIDGREGPEFDAVQRDTLVFSADGKQVAYFALRGKEHFLVRNGKEEAVPYMEIVKGSLTFSPDGRFAYAAYREPHPIRWYHLVIDGREEACYQYIQGPLVFSHDGKRLALVNRQLRGGAVLDGKAGKEYLGMGIEGFVFSPDSKRMAHLAVPEGGKMCAVVDGVEGKLCRGVGEVSFSPDSKRVATAFCRGDKWFIDVDGVESGSYDTVSADPIKFSADSRRWSISAKRGDKHVLLVDGKESSPYDGIGTPVFSPDGRHVAAQTARDGKQFILLDGKESKPLDGVGSGSPTFASDGRMAFSARRGKQWFVSVDGKETEVAGHGVFMMGFSPDGGRLYTMVGSDGKLHLEINNKQSSGTYDSFFKETFLQSPKGSRQAFVAVRGDKHLVVLDGVDGKQYMRVWEDSLTFSPDGRRFAYAVIIDKKWVMVVDGVEGKPYDMVWKPAFSPQGKRVAYVARRGSQYVMVVDGVEGPAYAVIQASKKPFSPDGKHVAYWAKSSNAWRPVVDGAEGKAYDFIVPDSELVFDSSASLHALAVRNLEVLRIDLNIASGPASKALPALVIRTQDVPLFKLRKGFKGKSITVSSDCRRIAYELNREGKWSTVVGDKEGKQYDATSWLQFSPDGKRVAYGARIGEEQLIVTDKEGKRYDMVTEPVFSANGKSVGYIARRGGRYRVVVDGKEGQEYDYFGKGSPVLSPDGKHSAAFMRRGEKDWFLIVDGVESGPYQNFALGSPVYSPDSNRLAAIVQKDDDWRLLLDGEETEGFGFAGVGSLKFSPDSKRLAAFVDRNKKYSLIVDGKVGEPYDTFGPGSLVFSPDSRRIAAFVRRDNKWHLLVDEKIQAPYDSYAKDSPVFSPDGHSVAAWVRRGDKWRLVVDGVEGPEYDKFLLTDNIQFSPDSQRVAYTAYRDKRWFIVVDGHEWEHAFEDVGNGMLTFSPDSRHLATWGKRDGNWSLVVDGMEQGRYAGPLRGSRIVFDNDRSFRAIAVQGTQVLAVNAQLINPRLSTSVAGKTKLPTAGWPGFEFLTELPINSRKYGVPLEKAVSVTFVYKGTPAEKAGLRVGDTILKLDGKDVKNYSWLLEQLFAYKTNVDFVLEIGRGGKRQNITLRTVKLPPDEELLQNVMEVAKTDAPYAQLTLGMMFWTGYCTPVNGEKAVYWLTKATEHGDPRAFTALGELYELGKAVPKDDVKAVQWFQRAVELDYPSAQMGLGNHYLLGTGVKRDYAKAIELYRRAVEQGSSSAKHNLGMCYLYGFGVPKDKARAIELMREAALAGEEKAISKLRELGIDPAGPAKLEPSKT
ncbi:MAG: PD40 domain-containing protein [Pirellulales bacterium]|nr:PD40 domain-containing protein [Pirellulales bacterium]